MRFAVVSKPLQGHAATAPPTSDSFRAPALGLQWMWSANPQPGWYEIDADAGRLRLFTQVVPEAAGHVRASPAILAQKAPASRFLTTVRVELGKANEGDRAGLIVNAMQYAWLGLRRQSGKTELVWTVCGPFGPRCQEQSQVVLSPAPDALTLRMFMNEGAYVSFSYSLDGQRFFRVGSPFPVTRGGWVGAQVGLFALGETSGSWLDVRDFELSAPGPGPH